MKLKKWTSIIGGAVIVFVLGNLVPLTNLYSKYTVHGHDDEESLVAIIILVEWPLLLMLGAFCGFIFYRKCLKKHSK